MLIFVGQQRLFYRTPARGATGGTTTVSSGLFRNEISTWGHADMRRCHSIIHTRRNRMAILQPGTQAPEFSLAAHAGDPQTLSGFRGRKTVVCFLPFAFTGG
ncbi:MAG: hypothetical protein EBT83_03475 [Betaproteobacteria bacterium]|nr:hypothetical protein [Betaproteobacteria bacterium]